MSTKGSAINLIQAAKDLSLDWEQTKTFWRTRKAENSRRSISVKSPTL